MKRTPSKIGKNLMSNEKPNNIKGSKNWTHKEQKSMEDRRNKKPLEHNICKYTKPND